MLEWRLDEPVPRAALELWLGVVEGDALQTLPSVLVAGGGAGLLVTLVWTPRRQLPSRSSHHVRLEYGSTRLEWVRIRLAITGEVLVIVVDGTAAGLVSGTLRAG